MKHRDSIIEDLHNSESESVGRTTSMSIESP